MRVATRREFSLQPLTSILSPLARGGAKEDTCGNRAVGLDRSELSLDGAVDCLALTSQMPQRIISAHSLWSSRLPVAQTRSPVETRLQRFS
jgi:hypothetical protein